MARARGGWGDRELPHAGGGGPRAIPTRPAPRPRRRDRGGARRDAAPRARGGRTRRARAVPVALLPAADLQEPSTVGGAMKLLKALISFIVGTIAGAVGSKLFGSFRAVVGFVAGGVAAWWVARRVFD